MARALLWRRVDMVGTDFALLDDAGAALSVRGVATGAEPEPHTCRWEVATGEGFATRVLDVVAEGAGWRRHLRLQRDAGGAWRASVEGAGVEAVDAAALDGALDVDVEATAFTNTLPIRRLGLLGAAPGTRHTIVAAWVRVPSLAVARAEQTYTVLGAGRIRYTQGAFQADLSVDDAGLVTDYPGYATRV